MQCNASNELGAYEGEGGVSPDLLDLKNDG